MRRQKNAPMENGKKAVAMVRVSTDRQANEGSSLDTQEVAIQRYCKARGLELVKVFRFAEGVSARKELAKRPGGQELLGMVERGEVRHVIGTKLDRLFRSSRDAKNHIFDWNKMGASLHLLQFGDAGLDTSTTFGKFFLGILGEIAELESNMIGDRVREVKAHKKAERLAYSVAPLGYRLSRGTLLNGRLVNRRLVPVPSEQRVIQRIMKLRSKRKPTPYHVIAAVLNAERVPTKKGGEWHASTVYALVKNSLHNGGVL